MALRILLVDDDLGIRETLSDALELEGHTVFVAEDGAKAIARLAAMSLLPDLILLDLMMPVMDGFQFRAEQRADPRFAHIPVIVISADPRLDYHREELAAHAYLGKPFTLDRLLAVVAR